MERFTHFAEHKGYKADNSVVSDDGRFMLFQLGKRGSESGEGFGILLFDFAWFAAFQHRAEKLRCE